MSDLYRSALQSQPRLNRRLLKPSNSILSTASVLKILENQKKKQEILIRNTENEENDLDLPPLETAEQIQSSHPSSSKSDSTLDTDSTLPHLLHSSTSNSQPKQWADEDDLIEKLLNERKTKQRKIEKNETEKGEKERETEGERERGTSSSSLSTSKDKTDKDASLSTPSLSISKDKTNKSTLSTSSSKSVPSSLSTPPSLSPSNPSNPLSLSTHLTQSELQYELANRLREQQLIKQNIAKTHRERVEEYNQALSKLSEHHDLPRIAHS
jgi:protein FAM32A